VQRAAEASAEVGGRGQAGFASDRLDRKVGLFQRGLFAPGAEWPEVDVHEGEERYYVISGEFLDRDHRLGLGSYVMFAPGSSHRPRTETGARMLGISILPR